MKKFFAFILIMNLSLTAFGVEQKYMPDGYVRDDVIHPYYVYYTNQYFQKVDKGEQPFSWRTYRQQVERPMRKVTDKLFEESRQGLYPRTYNNTEKK